MDGELDDASAAEVIAAMENGDDMLTDWETYHVIGDALRQPIVSIDVSEQVKKHLAGKPLLLVPRLLKPHRFHKQKLMGLSVAASIAALSLGWLLTQSMEQHQALQEVYVAESIDQNASVSDKRSVTFQPASIYTYPPASMSNNGNYPLIYRGFTHGGMVYHPHAGTHQIAEPQENPVMSGE